MLELRRKNKMTTVNPTTSDNDNSESTFDPTFVASTSNNEFALKPTIVVPTSNNDNNEFVLNSTFVVATTCSTSANISSGSEDPFKCNYDNDDLSFRYDSRDESDDDDDSDSGIANNDDVSRPIENDDGGLVASETRAIENDDGDSINEYRSAQNDEAIAINDEAIENNDNMLNANVVESTLGQAKKKWYDLMTFDTEDQWKAYAKEENFSINRTELRATKIKHTYLRCKMVKKCGPKCDAQLAVRHYVATGKYLIQTNNLKHTCEDIGNKMTKNLREDCDKMRKIDIAPRQACHFLQEKYGQDAISMKQLYGINKTLDANNKRRFTTLGEVIDFLEAKKNYATDDDPFVLGIKHSDIGADETKLQFVVSTRRLLETAKRFQILACDATYKTNAHGYPLMILGGLDANQKLHVLAYCVSTHERTENYQFLFECVASSIWQEHQQEFSPRVLVADGAIAIANGFREAFPNSHTRIVMCYFHVKYAIKKHFRGVNAEAIFCDIDMIRNSPTQRIFERAVELFEDKWKEVEPGFCTYFVRNWVRMRSGWYEGFEPGCASTNNAVEGFNGTLKQHYTYHKLLQIGVLFNSLGRVLRDKSKVYEQLEMVQFPTIETEAWIGAIKWAQVENLGTVLHSQTNRKAIHYVPSAEMRAGGHTLTRPFIHEYEHLVAEQLADVIKLIESVYRVEINFEMWQNSKCSCPKFCRKGICKHILGMAIKLDLVTPPPNTNPALLKQPKKVVPNVRATPALQLQPHFENAQQQEPTVDVQIHLPVEPPPSLPSSSETLSPSQQMPPTRSTRSNRAGQKPATTSTSSQQVPPLTKTTRTKRTAKEPPTLPSTSDTLASTIISQPPSQQMPPTRTTRANRAGKKPATTSTSSQQVIPPTKTTRLKRMALEPPMSELPAPKKMRNVDLPLHILPSPTHLIAFGGLSNPNSASGQSFKDGAWLTLRTSKQAANLRAANCSYAHNDGKVLISGGITSATLKRTAIIDLRDGKVTKLGSMQTARCGHASAYFADTFYVAGGNSSSRVNLDSVEK